MRLTSAITAPTAMGMKITTPRTTAYPLVASHVRRQLPVNRSVVSGTIMNRPSRAATNVRA